MDVWKQKCERYATEVHVRRRTIIIMGEEYALVQKHNVLLNLLKILL